MATAKNPFPLREYHSELSPKFKGDNKVRFGLELEVNGDHKPQARAMAAAGFTKKDVYSERDSTVDVEWVTRPLTEKEAPEFIRKAVTALVAGGATIDNDSSCGCHHNVDKFALDELGWGRVCIALHVFRDELFRFSGEGRDPGYAEKIYGISRHSSAREAFSLLETGDHHDCISWYKSKVVELRLPGMSLDPAEMVTQFKLYANLIRNMSSSKADPLDFRKAFGPFDDEMLQVLSAKGLGPLTGAKPMSRLGHWDLRKGDTVRVLDSKGTLKYHGVKVPDSVYAPGSEFTVVRVRRDPRAASELLPAYREVEVEDDDGDEETILAYHLLAARSCDGSKLLPEKPAPLVFLPPDTPAPAPQKRATRTSTRRS